MAQDPGSNPLADPRGGTLERRHWAWISGLAIFMHVAALTISRAVGDHSPSPNTDHVQYMRDVLAQGYPNPGQWPPGFSYWLALKWKAAELLGLPYWTSRYYLDVVPVVLGAWTSVKLGQLLTRNRFLAMAAGIGLLVAPIFILGAGKDEAAVVFQPIFLLSLWLFVRELSRPEGPRAMPMLGAGLLMGVACEIRANPQYIVAVLALVAFTFTGRRGISRLRVALVLGLFLLGQALPMTPWAVYRHKSGASGAMAFGNVYGLYFSGVRHETTTRLGRFASEHEEELSPTLLGLVAFHRRFASEDPVALLDLYATKALRTWYGSDSGRWDVPTLVLHLPFWVLAIVGFWRWRRRDRSSPERLLCVLLILYFWALAAFLFAIARYTAPLYTFIGLLGGIAVEPWLGRRRDVSAGAARR